MNGRLPPTRPGKRVGIDLLAIYLNDHLASATAGRELAKRATGSNRGTSYSRFLNRLAKEIDEDRGALLEVMDALEIGTDRLKVLGGWAAKKLGRFKLNGRLVSYSPLSRLVELEALALGVRGKLAMRATLRETRDRLPQLDSFDLARLITRAESQLERLESQRLRAASEAFS